ncbi:MAG TPA: glutamate-5-semialdehyde dehydrogenase [bacterium]|nr:glutamate-5-semialdehyde dehydrogenase [bacterium]HOL46881.1 glutamate-5-semialdehyde dehydrogenase [bacterium]HPQ18770.1 glutamate-5-semialdehyde dehydrogenase [bacterium]
MERNEIIELCKKVRESSYTIAKLTTKEKNELLKNIQKNLINSREKIMAQNQIDISNGEKKGLNKAMLDRLLLTEKRFTEMVNGINEIINLPDPVYEMSDFIRRPSNIIVGRMRVPIGVIGIIYEARPNVTVDAAVLCIKAGNSVILRGGSESYNSNIAIIEAMKNALKEMKLNEYIISYLMTPAREAIDVMLEQEEYIDLIIPRGGEGLIRHVVEKSKIPVLKHYKGVCHIYVEEDYNFDDAIRIIRNAKLQRPAVCNAVEKVLVHKNIAEKFLPILSEKLKEVELRGCEISCKILPQIKKATEEDWYAEYLDLILTIKVVNNLDEAIAHINKYSSKHTDSILTNNYQKGMQFLKEVDSSTVLINASTRFSDGGQFGLGAEIGISTDKLHARGPMGLKELTTQKFIVFGNGEIRE